MKFFGLFQIGWIMAVSMNGLLGAAAEHPRLLVSPKDVPALRARAKSPAIAPMVARLREQADRGASDEDGSLATATQAHQCAFDYILSGDEGYAKKARELVESLIEDTSWANRNLKGLTLYTQGVYVALAYDHCFGAKSWDSAFSAKVSKKLLAQADVIMRSGGREQNRNAASNWQGLRWSSAGLCLLATDEPLTDPKAVPACYRRTMFYLRANLGTDAEGRGWNCEGLGYTYYPMGNGVAPFVIAMQRIDPKSDARKEIPAVPWSLWTCYATTVKTPTGLWRPDFGDDNPGTRGEGCYGFAFWFAPPEIQPGLKWWYDRTVGAHGDRTYDSERFGNVSSILYYPTDLPAKDPMTIPEWRSALAETGGNGYVAFRNHYRDESDVVGQLYAKLRGNRGHSGPDALSFRIVGMGAIWATGGGRYGVRSGGQDVYWRSQNTVYPVDPDGRLSINGNSGTIVGDPVQSPDGGGSVVMRIAKNNVGAREHTRRFLADFSDSGAAATFVISDTSADGRFWQLATLKTNRITTAGNTFTIESAAGATMRGTILYPSEAKLKTGERPRGSAAGDVTDNNFVTVEGSDGAFLVILTLAEAGKPHPAATASGKWTGDVRGNVTVGGLNVEIQGQTIRRTTP